MDASVFDSKLHERTKWAEQVLREHLPGQEGLQGKVMEAMNYSVLAGGKRLRPILMWETYRMCGGQQGSAIEHFMAAIEMIHTYSLVHDDLPAMDNDRYRRGRETTWYAYGEAMGILAGDGLLNYAFETALRALWEDEGACEGGKVPNAAHSPSQSEADGLHPEKRVVHMEQVARALSVLARKAGIYGMIGGQVVDVMAENIVTAEKDISRVEKSVGITAQDAGRIGNEAGEFGDRLLFIHAHKTAALIQAAMMTGAILAGATDGQVAKIEKCAYNVGLAFQIQDDILDVIGDSRELGKSTGSDAQNGKVTYVTWKGMEQSRTDVEALSREAVSILDGFAGEHDFLKELILALIYRRK